MNTGGPLRRPSENLTNHRAGAFLVFALSVAAVGCWWHGASLRQASAPNLAGLFCCSAVDLAGRTRPNQLGDRNGWSKERKEWCWRNCLASPFIGSIRNTLSFAFVLFFNPHSWKQSGVSMVIAKSQFWLSVALSIRRRLKMAWPALFGFISVQGLPMSSLI